LASRSLVSLVRAVAASERGWPIDERNAGLERIPEVNPIHEDLVTIHALLDGKAQSVRPDGRLDPELDEHLISEALDRLRMR
jgi:hypothetical protein